MDAYRELGERLKALSAKRSAPLYQGIVQSIEGNTCTIEVDGIEIPDVRLRASISSDSDELLIIPAIGSVVIVGSLTSDIYQLVVLAVDRADTIIVHGGKRGGLVLVEELTDKLNSIEQEINQLKKILASWTPVPNDGGASLKGALVSWSGSHLTETQRRDIENPNIKQ